MLQARAFRTANQENPHAHQHQPASKGASKQETQSGRVLGHKDGNQGNQGNQRGQGKQGTQGTQGKAPLLSPPPARAPVLPVHLRTPSPGLQRLATLSHQISPDAALELDQDLDHDLEDQPEVDCEDDVEYAGPSAADYDEPYEDTSVPDLRNGNFGALLRTLPIAGNEGHEAWEAHDAAERAATKFAPDAPVEPEAAPRPDETSEPLFPLPARRALATKSSDLARSTLSNSLRLPPPSARAPPSSVRATPSSSRLTVARAPPSALSSRSASPAISRTRPPTTARTPLPSTLLRKPVTSSLARPTPARPAPTSAFSLTPAPTPLRPAKLSAMLAASSAASDDDDEAALGIFGIVTDHDAAFRDEMVDHGFRFEL